MRKFLKKIILFIVICLSMILGIMYISHLDEWRSFFTRITNSNDYISALANGSDEIKPYILEVQKQNDTEILIIGDSMCNQMFQNLQGINENITIAGTNGAITMAGQYIMAKEYLDNHDDVTDVYLMVYPGSLYRTFDTNLGYQYVIMPFSETGTLDELDQETIDICKEVYGEFFLRPEVVYLINKSGLNRKIYLNLLSKYGESYEQKKPYELADKYIYKIYEMCEERGATLYLIASPVSERNYESCKMFAQEYEGTWMQKQYPDFYKDILVFANEQTEDGVHFSGAYEEQKSMNEKIEFIFKDTPLLDTLRLE